MTKERILFYGPPAVGKSTLLKSVHKLALSPTFSETLRHAVTIDLESIGDSRSHRRVIVNKLIWWPVDLLLVGAANLTPGVDVPFDDWRVVALIPESDDEYNRRLEQQIKENPSKEMQRDKAFTYRDDIRVHCDKNRERLAMTIDPLKYRDPEGLLLDILRKLEIVKN